MIEFRVVKKAKEAVLYFVQDLGELWSMTITRPDIGLIYSFAKYIDLSSLLLKTESLDNAILAFWLA